MKKIYVIRNEHRTYDAFKFKTKSEAEIVCAILNKEKKLYNVAELTQYESTEDYYNHNKNKHIQSVAYQIVNLKNEIKAFSTSYSNQYNVFLFDNSYNLIIYPIPFFKLAEIVKRGPKSCNFTIKTNATNDNGQNMQYKVKPSDYAQFVKTYNIAIERYEQLKSDLKKYQIKFNNLLLEETNNQKESNIEFVL